jgi:hypothetical protein
MFILRIIIINSYRSNPIQFNELIRLNDEKQITHSYLIENNLHLYLKTTII